MTPRATGLAVLAVALDPAREASKRVLDGIGREGFFLADDWELIGLAVMASRLALLPLDPVVERASRAISAIAMRHDRPGDGR